MKKKLIIMTTIAMLTIALTACAKNTAEDKTTADSLQNNETSTVQETQDVDVPDETNTEVTSAEASQGTGDLYDQLVGTWEEDSEMTYRLRVTFYSDRTVKVEYTEGDGADYGTNAKFDGENITWKTSDGFGNAMGPIKGFDGKKFTVEGANAYEESKTYKKQ